MLQPAENTRRDAINLKGKKKKNRYKKKKIKNKKGHKTKKQKKIFTYKPRIFLLDIHYHNHHYTFHGVCRRRCLALRNFDYIFLNSFLQTCY